MDRGCPASCKRPGLIPLVACHVSESIKALLHQGNVTLYICEPCLLQRLANRLEWQSLSRPNRYEQALILAAEWLMQASCWAMSRGSGVQVGRQPGQVGADMGCLINVVSQLPGNFKSIRNQAMTEARE